MLKPQLRVVQHQRPIVVPLVAGVAFVLEAGSARARLATAIDARSVGAG
jgi:hypothetical protein